MGFDAAQIFGTAGSTLKLARVDDYEYAVGMDGNPALDSNNLQIPTGRMSITMLDNSGSRDGVPFAIAAGNSAFMGVLPEIGSTAIVGWKEQLDPVILAFLPPSLDGVISGRGTFPALLPGEALMQGSFEDVTDEGRTERFVGASVKCDAYGRLVVAAPDYKLIVGYLLSDEHGPDVTSVNDPITNQQIYLQETLPGGTSRRVDNDGSAVWTYGRHKYERVAENVDVRVGGTIVQEAAQGQTFQDKKNNSFGLDADGNYNANLTTGGYTVDTQRGHTFKAGGPVSRQTFKGLTETIGQGFDQRVGTIRTTAAAAAFDTVLGAVNQIIGGLWAVTVGGLMNLTVGGVFTVIAPQIILGPAPQPLTTFPGFSAFASAVVAALNGIAPGSGAAAAAAIAGASTTVVKGT